MTGRDALAQEMDPSSEGGRQIPLEAEGIGDGLDSLIEENAGNVEHVCEL
jgi:hypothetical protein